MAIPSWAKKPTRAELAQMMMNDQGLMDRQHKAIVSAMETITNILALPLTQAVVRTALVAACEALRQAVSAKVEEIT